MSTLQTLIHCAGAWQGVNRLYLMPEDPAEESPSTLTVTPLLGGRFVRLDQTWDWKGDPQEGSVLIGYDADAGVASLHWIDSFHMGSSVLACRGTLREDGTVDVLGSYPAPEGPDWGWRTVISPGPDGLELTMYNIEPDGPEQLAVQVKFGRVES